MHDKGFLGQKQVPAHSMLVFDKTYNYYRQFAKWTEGKIYFVTRQKNNSIGEILETSIDRQLTKEQSAYIKKTKKKRDLNYGEYIFVMKID